MADLSENEFRRLAEYIEEVCGIHLDVEKMYLVETRLTKLMALEGCDNFGQFHDLLRSNKDPNLRDKIVDAITTNETFWFRDNHPYQILREVLLPEMESALRQGKVNKVRIWSAAASTGQEAYSIGMTIHEYCRLHPGVKPSQFEIVATDISPAALAIARNARYDQIAVSRGMPDDIKARYFVQDGRVWILDSAVSSMVEFRRFNLMDSMILLGRFDIVFVRYVLIYFGADLKRKILGNISGLLRGPGYLVIGGTESLRGFSEDFAPHLHGGGTFHQLNEAKGY